MANGGNIQYGISFKVNDQDLKKIKQSLDDVSLKLGVIQSGGKGTATGGLEKLLPIEKVNEFKNALQQAYNPKLDTYNVKKFAEQISKSSISANELKTALKATGSGGAVAFDAVTQSVLRTKKQVIETNKVLDDMATSFANTVKWGISSAVFNTMTNSISQAYGYVKNLDKSLNDIRIVTRKSADEMERFAKTANNAAKELGARTTDYTNAALIYYQQGDSNAEAQAKASTTLKAANVTGQDTAAVSEQLTAVWNGFNVAVGQTEAVVDKLAAVAATTASDLEELATGMSKVASAASTMGVDVDQLSAQMSTIISVTRQAPESVGTALKTIYARLGDLKADGTDEFGVTLGEVSEQMKQMGINVMDESGNLRDMGEVIEEVSIKWDTWTKAQKNAAAIAMAGKRQYNNLFALFENWDMYEDALETSTNALGTLEEQNTIYLDSVDGRLTQLRTKWEELYSGLIEEDDIKTGISAMEELLSVFTNFTKATGGGITTLLSFGSILSGIFSQQIGKGVANMQKRRMQRHQNERVAQRREEFENAQYEEEGRENPYEESTAELKKQSKRLDANQGVLTEEEIADRQTLLNDINDSQRKVEATKANSSLDIQKEVRRLQEEIRADEEKGLEIDKNKVTYLNQQLDLLESIDDLFTNQNNFEAREETLERLNAQNEVSEDYGLSLNEDTGEIDFLKAQERAENLEIARSLEIDTAGDTNAAKENAENIQTENLSIKNRILELDAEIESFESDILKAQKDLNEEEEKELKSLKKTLVAEKEIEEKKLKSDKNRTEAEKRFSKLSKERQDEVLRILKEEEGIEDSLERQNKLLKEGQQYNEAIQNANEVSKDITDIENKKKEAEEQFSQDDVLAKRAAQTEVLTTSVSSLTLAYSSLASVYQVWADENATWGEKLISTFTTVLTYLPMMVNAYNSMSDAMEIYKTKKQALQVIEDVSSAKNVANNTAEAASQEVENKVDEAAAKVKAKKALEQNKETIAGEKGTIQNLKDIATTNLETGEDIAGATAKGAKAIIETLGGATPIVAMALGLIGAGIIGSAVSSYNKSEEQKTEQNNKTIEEENERQEELEKNNEGLNKIAELNESYKQGKLTFNELNTKIKDTINEYNLQGTAIENATGNLNEFNETLLEAKIKNQEALIESAERERVATESNLTQRSFWTEGKGHSANGGQRYNVDVSSSNVDGKSKNFLIELEKQFKKQGLDYKGDLVEGGNIEFDATAENFAKYVEAIRETQKNSTAEERLSTFGQGFADQVEKFSEAVDKYANAEKQEEKEKVTKSTLEELETILKNKDDNEKFNSNDLANLKSAIGYEKLSDELKEVVDFTLSNSGYEDVANEVYTEKQENIANSVWAGQSAEDRLKIAKENGEFAKRNDEDIFAIMKELQQYYTKQASDNVGDDFDQTVLDHINKILETKDYDLTKEFLTGKYIPEGQDVPNDWWSYQASGVIAAKTTGENQTKGAYNRYYLSEDSFDSKWISEKNWIENEKNNILEEKDALVKEYDNTIKKLGLEENKLSLLENNSMIKEIYDEYNSLGTANPMEEAISFVNKKLELEKGQEDLSSITSFVDALKSGKELTEQQEAELEKLEEEYVVLGSIQDKNSKTYLNTLEEVQDKLEENNVELAMLTSEDLAQVLSNVEVDLEDSSYDNFKNKILELTEQDYNIQVAIEADMKSDFDNMVSKIESAEKAASAIGENFIVDAEQLQELNSEFPNILDGVQYLTDGTAKLSQESVEAAITNKEKEVKIENEKALNELKNNEILIRNRIEYATIMADIAQKVADGEISEQEGVTLIQGQLQDVQQKKDYETALNELTTNETVQKSEEETARAIATNYQNSYKIAAQSLSDFYEIAKEAKLAYESGEDFDVDSHINKAFKDEFEAYTPKNIELNEEDLLNEDYYSEITGKEQWQQIHDSFDAQISALTETLNTNLGYQAELVGRTNSLDYKFNNVRDGKGESGGSSNDPSQEDYIDGEIDKFHDLEKAIQRTEDALDRLATAEERAFGQDLIDNLDAQLENLEGQTALQEKKKDLAIQEAAALQTSLASQGVSFDEEGTITNYQSIIAEKINATNKIIEAYNGMSASEQEANEETVNKAKEDLEKFQEEIENYEEYIYDTIPEIQSRIDEIMDEKVEINVKKLNMEVDLRMKIIDSKDTFRTFKTQVLEGLEEGMLGYASSTLTGIQGMFEPTLNAINADVENLALVEEEIKKMQNGETSNVFGNNMQVALEEMENIQSRLMDNMTSYYDLQQEANETYNASLDKLQEMLDLQQELYSNLNDIYEHGKELSALLYGEDDWANRLAFDTEQFNILKDALADSQDALEASKARLDELEEGTVEWCEEQARYNTLLQQTNDLEAQALEKAKEVRNDGVEKTLQSIEKNLFGGLSFEDAKENWEKLKEESDKYFDSIERDYQMDTLERSFNKALSQNNSSLKAQKQLNQLKDEELKKLKEKENLSQYDVDRAQKLLDIEMAKIALEEAQNNKSTLKLKRDAQGNYSYQYVANQDDIAEKEQNLADAENDLYQMDQEEYKRQIDEQYASYEEFANNMRELQDLGLAETEEFYRLLDEGYNTLMTNMTNASTDMNTARTNLETTFFDKMTTEKVPQWAGDMEQMALDHGILESEIDSGTTEIEGYWTDAQTKMDEVSTLVNKDYGDIVGSTKIAASTTKDLSDKVNDLTEEYKEDVVQAKLVKNAIDEITKSQQAQITKAGEAITKNQEFYTNIQEDAAEAASKITKSFETMAVDVKSYLDQANSYAEQAILAAQKAAQAGKDAAGVRATGHTSAKVKVWGGNGSEAEIGAGATVFAAGGADVYQDASAKNVVANVEHTNTDIKVLEVTQDGTMAKVELESGEVGYIPTKNLWVEKSRVNKEGKAFDTGGYTGDWNSSEGRMAWLHEKELVLNKTDTKNMLKAIELTRSMDDIINSLESSVVNRINRLTQQLNEMVDCINIKAKLKDAEQKFEQNVEIHAEFPNVKGVDEIEQAFDNLNNRATQLSNYLRF